MRIFIEHQPLIIGKYTGIMKTQVIQIGEATKHNKGQNLPILRSWMDFNSKNCIVLGRVPGNFVIVQK